MQCSPQIIDSRDKAWIKCITTQWTYVSLVFITVKQALRKGHKKNIYSNKSLL